MNSKLIINNAVIAMEKKTKFLGGIIDEICYSRIIYNIVCQGPDTEIAWNII